MRLSRWLPFGTVPEMTPKELKDSLTDGEVQILDVRTGTEYELSHIPGARHLPIHHFSQNAVRAMALDADRPVVAICLSAHRSIPAVRQLREMGFQATQLRGGMKAWWRQGMPTRNQAMN